MEWNFWLCHFGGNIFTPLEEQPTTTLTHMFPNKWQIETKTKGQKGIFLGI